MRFLLRPEGRSVGIVQDEAGTGSGARAMLGLGDQLRMLGFPPGAVGTKDW